MIDAHRDLLDSLCKLYLYLITLKCEYTIVEKCEHEWKFLSLNGYLNIEDQVHDLETGVYELDFS